MALQRQLRVVDGGEMSAPVAPLKVAFATSDLKHVDQHFGSAERFAIYAVEPHKITLLEVAQFGILEEDGNENKLLEKFVILDGCAAVYCRAVGGSAVRQLLGLGVQPLKVPEGIGIDVLLYGIQRELREGPTGWLARAYERTTKQDRRFDAMEAEGWEE
jgi:nitrogen fixation protein NifX